ncbi:hypothetical protein [Myxococcus stipitatus]|uniref:hypothetical protein n=1 Tax=Myxococcus stipitatus TaxID=83455 RepID=UPI0030CC5185
MSADEDDALDTESTKPCKTFYRLESLEISRSTRIDVGCLEIPDNAVIDVKNGAAFYVIATRGVKWGRSVSFKARGGMGAKGVDARSEETKAGTDGNVWHSRQGPESTGCHCVDNKDWPELRAGKGGDGAKGGVLRFVMRNVQYVGGATLDAMGGDPGPQGRPGRLICYCKDGCGKQVASNSCPGGGPGARGAKGTVDLYLAGPRASTVLTELKKAVVTEPEHIPLAQYGVLEPASTFQKKVDVLRDEAVHGHFELLPAR